MRGHGTAYLAESVKFFSPTRVFRDRHAALTSVTNASKISATWRAHWTGSPLQRNCLFAPHLKFTVLERFRPCLDLAAGDALDVSD